MDRVESKIDEYASSDNVLVDAHTAQGEEISWLKDKVTDMEDRSRRNNLKIRGIPESVPLNQLQYAQTLFSTLVPTLTPQDLIVDRIHRVPKPSFLPDKNQKDVLLRVHYYHMK